MFNTNDDELPIESLDLVSNPTAARRQPSADVQRLRERLEHVQRELWAAQAQILEPGQVRLVGRLAEVKIGQSGTYATIHLVIPDGEERDRVQVVRLRIETAMVANAWLGAELTLVAGWRYGRLMVIDLEGLREVDAPMPEVPASEKPKGEGGVPDWFDSKAKNEKHELLKASDGSSTVSRLMAHLVFCTKRRGKVLSAAMVTRLKSLVPEVVKAKSLGTLLAVNGEADHVHVALWLPANLAGSEAMGHIKSYTSRLLRREFPELRGHDEDALWQRGGFVGGIGNGGDLTAVLRYINEQQSTPLS